MTVARSARVLALSLLVLSPLALASPFRPGPHFGVVAEGEVDHHFFILFPYSQPCRNVPTQHALTLVYAPPTDALTLTIQGVSVTGSNGVASASFAAPPCTTYAFDVAGTSVESTATYDVALALAPDA